MSRTEIRVTGYGGQGVVLCAYIIGRANAVNAGHHSTMIQSFGPEARGSACAASVVLDEEVITYPYLRRTDVLIALSREGYEKYADELKDSGVLIYDEDLVEPDTERATIRAIGIPATRLAEDLGKRIVQNIVVVGFAIAATEVVSKKAALEAVETSVPEALVDLNRKAFETGYEYFQRH